MIQRNFIKSLQATAGFSTLRFKGCKIMAKLVRGDFYRGFANPPDLARPFSR
jgi:hypothetical protein